MYIVIHCGGLPFNGETIKTEALGGSETAAYYVAMELAERGHKVTMFTNTNKGGEWDGVLYVPAGKATEAAPLGEHFHYYAAHTPHDVLIIQRHPNAFTHKYASKVNLLWLHDLALHRFKGNINAQMVNVDGVLTVSEWHKRQVCEVYDLDPDVVHSIGNGIDLSLFDKDLWNVPADAPARHVSKDRSNGRKPLLFAARPERGLEELVQPGGVMELLANKDPHYHLYVCGYVNTTGQMKDYYDYLNAQCERLPNVTMLGALSKQELADVMRLCNAYVYPTSFEDTSCIVAMECAAAGLPFFAFKTGALPETTKGAGARLLDLKDGEPDLERFANAVHSAYKNGRLSDMSVAQRDAAFLYSWGHAVDRLTSVIDSKFGGSPGAILTDLIRMSDVYAARHYLEHYPVDRDDPIVAAKLNELEECYAFTESPEAYRDHYAAYYQYEKDRGVEYGPEDVTGTMRFRSVADRLMRGGRDSGPAVSEGGTVLDYGCAHGAYIIPLAKAFPHLRFVGVDISESNIEKARQWAADAKCDNVEFYVGEVDVEEGRIHERSEVFAKAANEPLVTTRLDPLAARKFDAIIAAEVLEHVMDPQAHIDVLHSALNEGGLFIATTPYGPWESRGYKAHWPWRNHVHHFERQDLHDMVGHFDDFKVQVAPQPNAPEPVGSYVWSFRKTGDARARSIDYDRKLRQLSPRQTVTLAMIVRDAAGSIRHCLEHALPLVDELVMAVDSETSDETREIVAGYMQEHWPELPFTVFENDSPTKIGFDEARNATVEKASGDWVLWIDSDETVFAGADYFRELRPNQFGAYAVQQHHFAIDPPQVLQTDLPAKLFRNHRGIRFYGVVHEHPEKSLNNGPGRVHVTQHLRVSHPAYATEGVRRGRFERNFPLLLKDREKHPKRTLGKMLMLRDCAQMAQRIHEREGRVTDEMVKTAAEGVKLFEELLEEADGRMLLNALEFYTGCAQLVGEVFTYRLVLDADLYGRPLNEGDGTEVLARFCARDHLDKLLKKLNDERLDKFGYRYM